ncbi:MAG: hypothetical protein C0399_08210 [Syntrophus sp. (in: bacteria)]|nr:hypothetical protein [Syntrophus sp. (in: bacteria)]
MKKTVILLCILCTMLFMLNLKSRDFWAPDEGDFAQIALELDNNPVTPHLNNEPYGEKPPLFYYLTSLSSKAFFWLSNETSMRIPSALFALLSGVFFFMVLYRYTGREKALIAALTLITTPLFYWQARYLQVDMVFAAFITGAFLSFIRFHHSGTKSFYYLFFVSAACAFMTKGPLAIALIAPVIFIYLATEKNFTLLKMKETYLGILLFIALVVPWYLAVYLKEGFPYLYENIIRQNMTRFFDAWSHKRPIYYYFTTLPLDFFPWILFLPTGIYLAIKRWKEDPTMRFFLIWFVWIFVFLSLSSGKISKYMLPALPAASFLASAIITEKNRYTPYVYNFLAIAFGVLGVTLFTYIFLGAFDLIPLKYKMYIFPEFLFEKIFIAACSLLVAFTLIFFTRKKKIAHAFYTLIIFMVAVYTIGNISVYNKVNPYKSSRPLCEKIRSLTRDGTPWVYYGSIRGVYVYYVGKLAIHIDEHDMAGLKALRGPQKKFFVLTRKRDAEEVNNTLPSTALVFEEKIGNTPMVVLLYKEQT